MLTKSNVERISVMGFARSRDVRDQTFFTDISLWIELNANGQSDGLIAPIQVAGLSGVYDQAIGFWLDGESRDRLSAELAKKDFYFPINILASQAIEDQIKNQAAPLH